MGALKFGDRVCGGGASVNAANLFLAGLAAHLVADWFLQNEYMALNKTSLHHPASWLHSGIHLASAALVFPMGVAFVLGVTHLLIDTRVPLQWWRRFFGQTTDGPAFIPFAMWQDQSAHLLLLITAAFYCAKP